MSDYSIRGMQFRSPVKMARGEQIWIRNTEPDEQRNVRRPPAAIKAVVRWCRSANGPDTPGFSVGVIFCNGHSRPLQNGRS
jgi:hypothetical protein